jgi:hypothetical protein
MMTMYWQPVTNESQRAHDYDHLVAVTHKLADQRVMEKAGGLELPGLIYLAYLNLRVQWLKMMFRSNYGKITP